MHLTQSPSSGNLMMLIQAVKHGHCAEQLQANHSTNVKQESCWQRVKSAKFTLATEAPVACAAHSSNTARIQYSTVQYCSHHWFISQNNVLVQWSFKPQRDDDVLLCSSDCHQDDCSVWATDMWFRGKDYIFIYNWAACTGKICHADEKVIQKYNISTLHPVPL